VNDPFGRPLAPIYLELRSRILTLDPLSIGIEQMDGRPIVWAVLFELGYPNGIATTVAIRDGTASMYMSSGGGVIGGAGRSEVAAEATRFVEAVEVDIEALEPTDQPPLPAPNRVAINARTFVGTRTGQAATAELTSGRHRLSTLYVAGQDLITQLRQAVE
jgi:hypothetical protein